MWVVVVISERPNCLCLLQQIAFVSVPVDDQPGDGGDRIRGELRPVGDCPLLQQVRFRDPVGSSAVSGSVMTPSLLAYLWSDTP